MDLSGAYSTSFRLMRVNTDTWNDEAEVPGLMAAKIDRNCQDEYPKLESGTYTINTPIDEEFVPGWYRLEMLATDAYGEHVRIPIATQLLQSGSGLLNRGADAKNVTGQSVLHPLAMRQMSVGTHVPKGINAIDWVVDLFETTPAPVQVLGRGFTVDQHYVFDPQTSYLRAVWDVLRLGDWCMQISGSGVVSLLPKPTAEVFVLDKSTRRLVVPGINYQYDYSEVPNHYVAIDYDGKETEVYNLDQEGSNTSVAAREGRIQDYVDTNPVPVNGEGMYGYVRRRLEEESTVSRMFSYTRRFVEGLYPFDIVSALTVSDGMVGNLRIVNQSLTCGRGISVTEMAGEEIKEYTR